MLSVCWNVFNQLAITLTSKSPDISESFCVVYALWLFQRIFSETLSISFDPFLLLLFSFSFPNPYYPSGESSVGQATCEKNGVCKHVCTFYTLTCSPQPSQGSFMYKPITALRNFNRTQAVMFGCEGIRMGLQRSAATLCSESIARTGWLTSPRDTRPLNEVLILPWSQSTTLNFA